ncbi:hypothetical protein [Dyella silvae]|uniref:hypothetical protein n=1 Tax=Dyella silvae TaxID=2994424 RepID=UPI0022651332|nr:hypothetical protein [Dyella silvae]
MSKSRISPSFLLGAAIAMAYAMPMAASAQSQAPAAASTVTSTAGELVREDQTITAKVVHVDQQSRFITLKGPNGNEETVLAGPEVKNLAQLKAGDSITAHYQAAVAIQLMPADSVKAGVDVQGGAATAPQGSKPGVKEGDAITVTTKLTAIDLKNNTITLTGADGHSRVIHVKDPARQADLKKLKVGDMMVITYVEALAITVTPKTKAKG